MTVIIYFILFLQIKTDIVLGHFYYLISQSLRTKQKIRAITLYLNVCSSKTKYINTRI